MSKILQENFNLKKFPFAEIMYSCFENVNEALAVQDDFASMFNEVR